MPVSFKELMNSHQSRPYLLKAFFGLEKESHRINIIGKLASSEHPESFGSRSYHPYIRTDFAETQIELITPVFENEASTINFLKALYDVSVRNIPENELIWPLSMPPMLPFREDAIPLAKLENPKDVAYREYLTEKYGKRKQMVSGIHFNFEFSDELLKTMYEQTIKEVAYTDFKTNLYMKVARQYLRYLYLIIYLFGASPRANSGYFSDSSVPSQPARSIRNSAYGYRNDEDIHVRFDNFKTYYSDLQTLVKEKKLSEMKEFYSTVRLRGGSKLESLDKTGIRYLELRNFDLNPFEKLGIDVTTMQFVHLFMLFLLWKEEKELPSDSLDLGEKYNNITALENPNQKMGLYEEAKAFFEEFIQFAKTIELPEEQLVIIQKYADLIEYPEKTLAARMEGFYQFDSNFGLQLAKGYKEDSLKRPFSLAGFDDMELSTQNLIADAILKGIKVEVLDKSDQFLSLDFKGHKELVKNGNMTARDSLVSYAAMENKVVTKKILEKAGFHVPKGEEFESLEEAQRSFDRYIDKAIVIKPKSTNYGLGISIFPHGAFRSAFELAVKLAFDEDKTILIEEYIEGTEYRFFVVDGKTRAVLKRENANVIGDGKRSIRQLIDLKNQHSLRGEHYLTPLEKIKLGEAEKLMLASQGYEADSILEKGVRVNLRENSNISTGGDSIDMTDEMHPSYKRIAEAVAYTLDVKVTGIDLMIPDYQVASNKEDKHYSIIEANYNPAMHMHLYPYKNKGRRVTMDILEFLYPEAFDDKKTV